MMIRSESDNDAVDRKMQLENFHVGIVYSFRKERNHESCCIFMELLVHPVYFTNVTDNRA